MASTQTGGKHMKVICFVVAAVFLTVTGMAQTEPEYLKTKALQFTINGLNLGTINGGVGGKVWTSERTAIAFSLAGGHSYDEADANSKQSGRMSTITMVQGQLGSEWHINPADNFSPYLAGAWFVRYDNQHNESSYSSASRADITITKKTSIGFCFGVGAEYWITKRISLAGQHLFQASYALGTQEHTDYYSTITTAQTIRGFNIGVGTSSLILSVYF
jgi:hypothetical protein